MEPDYTIVVPTLDRPENMRRILSLFPNAVVTVNQSNVSMFRDVVPKKQLLPHPDLRLIETRNWILENIDRTEKPIRSHRAAPGAVPRVPGEDIRHRGRKEIARLPRRLRPGPGEKMQRLAYWCPQCKRRWSVIHRLVPARPKRCPRCGSQSTRVTSSPRKRINGMRIRHHACRDCSKRFKSVELPGG